MTPADDIEGAGAASPLDLLPRPTEPPPQVHPTAIVESGAVIGPGARIGPRAIIGPEVRLGARVVVGPYVVLSGDLEIGADTRIWPFACLGEEPQDVAFDGEASSLRIGPRCLIREHVTVHRGTGEGTETVIESDVFLMASSHVAHNCRVREGAIVANGALVAGHVDVGRKAFVSGNTAVHQFVRIGDLAMIGGLSEVNRDVLPYALLARDARIRGLNRVGLERAGVPSETREELRELYRILRKDPVLTKAVPNLNAQSPEGKALIEFLSAPSKRGFCRF